MRLFLFLLVLATVCVGVVHADAYTDTSNKIKNLLSTFLTPKEVKALTDWLLEQYYAGKTDQYIQDNLMTEGMSVLTAAQKAQVTGMMAKLNTELGGVDKAKALIAVLQTEINNFIAPFLKEVKAVMAKQKAAKKTKAQVKTASLNAANKFLTAANVQKAINNIKTKFSPAQCQTAFKYLAPTYIMLGKYKFLNPPCTGKGV